MNRSTISYPGPYEIEDYWYFSFAGLPVALWRTNSFSHEQAIEKFVVDHLGTPVAWTTVPTSNAGFEPFGADYAGNLNSLGTGHIFPGQTVDVSQQPNTSLYYNVNRWYEQPTGKYTRTDPRGRWGDPHPFAYAQSNPLRFSDPKGLDSVGCDLPAFVGILANDSPCALACCAAHDKCYDGFKCTAGSWLNPAGQCSPAGCTLCNGTVEACLAKCLAFDEFPSGPQYYCPSLDRFVSIPGDFSSLDDARPVCEEDHSKRCCEAEPESLGNLFGAVF